jgi:hypothetical protein
LSLPVQALFPGRLERAYHREFQNLVSENAVSRLWKKDPSLWPAESFRAKSVETNLGWLDLPSKMGPYMKRVAERARDIEPAGFEDVVFIAMGGSNLAAETILRNPGAKIAKQLFLLDSTDPGSIRALEEKLNLERTLFIFSNKSGKGIETHALLLYFLERLKSIGVTFPGSHFVALTEENSYLAQLALQYHFADIFLDPPGISGRFSSLIHFGLFLSGVSQIDPVVLLTRMKAMSEACGPATPNEMNPALALGAFLAAGEIEGFDRLILLTTDSVERFAYRIGNLVGTSTGKEDHGIIPIFGQLTYSPQIFENASMAVILTMKEDDDPQLAQKSKELKQAGVPLLEIELNGRENLGVELFKWEIATALACSRLAVDPFHDPDVRESRASTSEILEQITTSHAMPNTSARLTEKGLELFAEGRIRQEISTLNMAEAFRTFLNLRDPEGYLALLPFVNLTPSVVAALRRIRDQIVSTLDIPVLVTSGPRYLHAVGQAYKGGPAKGLFLVLTAEPMKDVSIPGARYSFGQLQLALALGDFRSLVTHQRPVLRLHLTQGAEHGITELEAVLGATLANLRRMAS